MQKIDRASVPTPTCLVNPPADKRYSHLRGDEKEEIRQSLIAIQAQRCAYCERRTGAERDDGHIEHFKKQADNPSLDLTWENMFWSCNDEKTCGKHKDKCENGIGKYSKFDSANLVDPSVDDPDDFFYFVTDGTIRIKDGLTEAQQKRAKETLRVFQLADSPMLRKAREDAVAPHLAAVKVLIGINPGAVPAYVKSVLPGMSQAPYSAAIRHFFRDYLSSEFVCGN